MIYTDAAVRLRSARTLMIGTEVYIRLQDALDALRIGKSVKLVSKWIAKKDKRYVKEREGAFDYRRLYIRLRALEDVAIRYGRVEASAVREFAMQRGVGA